MRPWQNVSCPTCLEECAAPKEERKRSKDNEGNMSVQISDTDHRNFMCKGEKTTKEIGQFRYLIQSIGILCG